MKPLNINLSAEERSKYGRVNEQNKLFVNKIYDYAKSREDLRSPDVDWAEFFKDYEDRNFYESVISRLDELNLKLKNHEILGDFDNHQGNLADYSFTSTLEQREFMENEGGGQWENPSVWHFEKRR